MFQVKICGVTRVEDTSAIAEAAPDAIGLNFFPLSARFVADDQAAAIIAALPASILKVGVFVNASADDIRRKHELLHLDAVQLHGDEPPELIEQLAGIPTVRAVRVRDSQSPLWRADQRCHPQALLVDAYSTAAYGGTGERVDWKSLPGLRTTARGLPLILAGGLTPENVAEAISLARPDGVDTASGVESAVGVKDPAKTKAFVEAARAALRKKA
jgi:phosphoribosylanthranilate isomerase